MLALRREAEQVRNHEIRALMRLLKGRNPTLACWFAHTDGIWSTGAFDSLVTALRCITCSFTLENQTRVSS